MSTSKQAKQKQTLEKEKPLRKLHQNRISAAFLLILTKRNQNYKKTFEYTSHKQNLYELFEKGPVTPFKINKT